VKERIAGDDLVLVDLTVGCASPDAQLVVGLDDPVKPAETTDVHEQARLGEPELEKRDEAVPTGEDLGLSLAVGQDLEGLPEIAWPDVVELAGDHRAAALLPA
jgi:hypothetical protein